MKITKFHFIILAVIAIAFRFYGISWDNGFHFHPDERMLILVAERISFFSNLNPDFFNYGSLPIYILKGLSQLLELLTPYNVANYDSMLYVGRFLSIVNDLLVLLLIYKIALLLFEKKEVAFFSTFFYTFAFFPIQNTHFFIVDTFLNLFGTLLIYLLLNYYKKPTNKILIFIAITFAAALTTKITALLFIPVIVSVFYLTCKGKIIHKLIQTTRPIFIFSFTALFFSFLFMPFAFIHFPQFLNEISLQLRMNSDPYTFPYTLQYVGTLPYLYYLKNIAIWGLGPFIFVYFLLGLYEHAVQINKKSIKDFLKHHHKKVFMFIIFYSFYALYFLIIGKSAVKFMRYMLILYPFFALMAGYGMYELVKGLSPKMRNFTIGLTVLLISIWTISFVSIYSQNTTRIRASEWIYEFIPTGSTLAVEHWDDRVPVYDPGKYKYEEMTLYERPDDEIKWNILNEKLKRSDYIIIASNRLYIPLQKLKDCNKYLSCYPITADYYDDLFAGRTDFQKMVEFTSYPRIPLGKWSLEIVDDFADESFTVYDHPKIMIYRRMK